MRTRLFSRSSPACRAVLAACSSRSDDGRPEGEHLDREVRASHGWPRSRRRAAPRPRSTRRRGEGHHHVRRRRALVLPSRAPDLRRHEPTPVVLDLHGYAEGAPVHLQMSDLGAFGDHQGFVTITPQGSGTSAALGHRARLPRHGLHRGPARRGRRHALRRHDRVFVTGLSNGAFLTSAIACRYADRVAAAAPSPASATSTGCDPSRPVPVIAFHGTADTFVSYDGGLGSSVANLPSPDG